MIYDMAVVYLRICCMLSVAFVFSNLVIAGTTFKSIIWFTFIIAEMLTALIGYFMLNRIVKNSLTFRAI